MVQIVEDTAFPDPERMPEFGDKPRLAVNDLGVRAAYLQDLSQSLARLRGLRQLPVDKIDLFLRAEGGGSGQTAELFLRNHTELFQHMPVRAHLFAGLLRHRVGVALVAVRHGIDKHQIVEDAVVLHITLGPDMLNVVIPRAELRDIDRLARINAFTELHKIEEKLVALQSGIRRRAEGIELGAQVANVLIPAFFIQGQDLLPAGLGTAVLLLRL